MKIADVKVGKRFRKKLGDIEALAKSIEAVGLLHPIVVDPNGKLIVGQRRLAACESLGHLTIPANVAKNLAELDDLLRAEADENTCRMNLNPEEGVAIGLAVEKAYKPKAEAAKHRAPGGDRRSDKAKNQGGETCPTLKTKRDESARTTAVAAAAAGMDRRTYEKAKYVIAHGDIPEIIAKMNATGKVDPAYRKVKASREHAAEMKAARIAAPAGPGWKVTDAQDVVACAAVVTDPPYGILDEAWEPKELEAFTRDWCVRWALAGADFIATFWSQRYLWEGRRWFDECLTGYAFQQLLVWAYRNNTSPQSRQGFKQTWEPIFFYRRIGCDRKVRVGGGKWGEDLHDLDSHVAAVPQSNFNEADRKVHPAQKPVSVMRWLVNALTKPGDMVADPFCGAGTCGIAAVQLSRQFHGIETDDRFCKLAAGRIRKYGVASV